MLESRLGSSIALGCATAWAGRDATLAREMTVPIVGCCGRMEGTAPETLRDTRIEGFATGRQACCLVRVV